VMWVMGKIVLVRLEIVLTLRKICARFAQNVLEAQKSFWMHPMELLGVGGNVESHLSPFGDCFNVGAR
jgi:hypothetical protein